MDMEKIVDNETEKSFMNKGSKFSYIFYKFPSRKHRRMPD